MADIREIDLRAAINAISEVVQNRPRPIREFDQIYMKTGDMVLQSELVASWADKKKLAFIGDGDAISVCVAYLQSRGIINYGPSEIIVFDFDERICNAVERFAEKEGIENIKTVHYNCLDTFPMGGHFNCFYTNPPWGASNAGESVKVFAQRGMEAIGYNGDGMVVIADDDELEWPGQVLAGIQSFSVENGFYVQRMMPRLHGYHLDDNPNLKSCNLILRSLHGNKQPNKSIPITDKKRLENFYGRSSPPTVKYVWEKKRVDYGKAHDDEYEFERMEEPND